MKKLVLGFAIMASAAVLSCLGGGLDDSAEMRACKNASMENIENCASLVEKYRSLYGESEAKKLCDEGDGEACMTLAGLYENSNGRKTFTYNKKACAAGNGYGCLAAGLFASLVLKDEETAVKLVGKSCDMGYKAACELMEQ